MNKLTSAAGRSSGGSELQAGHWTCKRGACRSKQRPASTQSTRTNQGLASKKAQGPFKPNDPRPS
ncbi:hypothetical protein PCANC_12401 [Puccinia coronata f. sp. avenae]|uniref:Uncharacterized protein n=1 Tax=Puccinia coronata f. sp. avenae TaxID=200324 RepID=A0A2N5VB88_9BASI|nr:hypothetical protein PCANC_12401 [Puccinia coronata f. sp. avenae]